MRRSRVLVGIVVLVGGIATLLAWGLAARVERDRGALALAEDSSERVAVVRQVLHESIQAVLATAAFWRASELVTEEEFASFAGALRRRQDHLESLVWVPRTSQGGEAIYVPCFVEPPELRGVLAGVDLGSDPERRRTFELARSTGREQLSGPMRLLHPRDTGTGLLLVMPVARAEGGSEPEGFVVATLRAERMLERALGELHDQGIDLELADGGLEGSPRNDRPLALRRAPVERRGEAPLRHEDTFVLGGRRFVVRTAADPDDLVRGRPHILLAVVASGVLATGFVVAIVLLLSLKNEALEGEAAERRRAEDARSALERQMFESQKLESLGTFAGGVAHDFNNILTGILGNADLARRKLPAGDPAGEYLERVVTATERAAVLTGRLLDYVGRSTGARERLDLGAVVRGMEPLLAASIPRKVELRLELGEDPPRLDGDAAQLRQVVANLVANGAEACDPQGGHVVVRTSVDAAASRCVLEVEDNGCGIDDECLGRIFEPFFTTKFTGRGLGLAAVQGIVRAHGGTIRVHSRAGHGTTFRVELPAAPSPQAAFPVAALSAAPTDGAILVVDDEPLIRELARVTLEGEGFRVLEATDGAEAVAMFLERRHDIRLVLTDMTMPRMHGDEALAAIRRAGGALPALLMTGYSEGEATARFEALGLCGVLRKPFLRADLLEKVRAALA